jgi:hypothetical protein
MIGEASYMYCFVKLDAELFVNYDLPEIYSLFRSVYLIVKRFFRYDVQSLVLIVNSFRTFWGGGSEAIKTSSRQLLFYIKHRL